MQTKREAAKWSICDKLCPPWWWQFQLGHFMPTQQTSEPTKIDFFHFWYIGRYQWEILKNLKIWGCNSFCFRATAIWNLGGHSKMTLLRALWFLKDHNFKTKRKLKGVTTSNFQVFHFSLVSTSVPKMEENYFFWLTCWLTCLGMTQLECRSR